MNRENGKDFPPARGAGTEKTAARREEAPQGTAVMSAQADGISSPQTDAADSAAIILLSYHGFLIYNDGNSESIS